MFLLPVAVMLVLAGCRETQPDPVRFVTSIAPLGLIVEELARGRAEVVVLLPPGASPHAFDPTPQQAKAAADATAVLYISGSLDGWAAGLGGVPVVAILDLAVPRELLTAGEPCAHCECAGGAGTGHHDHSHNHHNNYDPHFWTDPALVLACLPALAECLAGYDPAGCGTYRSNAERFAGELHELQMELAARLAPARGKAVLQMHNSFNYLFRRYGIHSVGAVEEWAGGEPSPRQLAGLKEKVVAEGVRVLFHEPGLPLELAASLIDECGLRAVELFPESLPPGTQTYADWVLENASRIGGAFAMH